MAARSRSLGRSVSFHSIGHDDAQVDAPAAGPSGGGVEVVEVVQLRMDNIEALTLTLLHNDGFGSKTAFCCIPVADHSDRIRAFYRKHPERLAMCGLATQLSSGKALGFVQIAAYPTSDKDGLHTTKPGETYVEQVCVSSSARGLGLGTKLMDLAEERGRGQRDHDTYRPVRQSSATSLRKTWIRRHTHKRTHTHAYTDIDTHTHKLVCEYVLTHALRAVLVEDCVEECCDCFCTLLFIGRPYGLFHGSLGSLSMRKDLAD